MADHFVALNRGVPGEKYSDFITGTASTAGTNNIELRVADGASLTRKDVDLALLAFRRFFDNAQQFAPAGFDVKP